MEARAWKKIKRLVECEKSRLWGDHREIVHHLLYGWKKLVGIEYAKRPSNILKVLAVNWAVGNGMVSKDTKWYSNNCKRGKVIEKDRKKIFWD